ncbi:MAG TPA: acylphosphatase [Actinomycetota bacterium]|nr:acylphosphatase [Actinomycetota bacterium]
MGESDRPEHAEVLSGDVCARVFVSGRVQGVFFRYTCAHEARQACLRGTVRNLSDGRVEAVFQGPKQSVERLISWCHGGPPAARVADVTVSWEPVDETLLPF